MDLVNLEFSKRTGATSVKAQGALVLASCILVVSEIIF